MNKRFLKAGHLPTLFVAFLYFDLSFMVWVLLGSLSIQIALPAVVALTGLTTVKRRWRQTWGSVAIGAARI